MKLTTINDKKSASRVRLGLTVGLDLPRVATLYGSCRSDFKLSLAKGNVSDPYNSPLPLKRLGVFSFTVSAWLYVLGPRYQNQGHESPARNARSMPEAEPRWRRKTITRAGFSPSSTAIPGIEEWGVRGVLSSLSCLHPRSEAYPSAVQTDPQFRQDVRVGGGW